MAGRKRSRVEWERPDATLTSLPDDVLAREIAPRLDAESVCALAQACTSFWAQRLAWTDAWIDARGDSNLAWRELRRASKRIHADGFFARATLRLAARIEFTDAMTPAWDDIGSVKWPDKLPIVWFAKIGRLFVVRKLLSHYDPSICDSSAIRCAAYYGHASIVRELMTRSDVAPCGYEVIRLASERGHAEVLRVFLDYAHTPMYDNVLFAAASRNDAESTRALLEHGYATSSDAIWALWSAARHNDLDVLELLLNHGADAKARNCWPLRAAIRRDHVEAVRLLLPHSDSRADYSKAMRHVHLRRNGRAVQIMREWLATSRT